MVRLCWDCVRCWLIVRVGMNVEENCGVGGKVGGVCKSSRVRGSIARVGQGGGRKKTGESGRGKGGEQRRKKARRRLTDVYQKWT